MKLVIYRAGWPSRLYPPKRRGWLWFWVGPWIVGWVRTEQSRCSTCGELMDAPPCSVNREIGWSGHTTEGGVAREDTP